MHPQISPCDTEGTSYFVRYLSAKGTKKHSNLLKTTKLLFPENGLTMRFVWIFQKLLKPDFDFRFPYGSPAQLLSNGFIKPFESFLFFHEIAYGSYLGLILANPRFSEIESLCDGIASLNLIFTEHMPVDVQTCANL